jgi:hypothetical protein
MGLTHLTLAVWLMIRGFREPSEDETAGDWAGESLSTI